MIKDLVKKRFAKSLKTYEKSAIVQKRMAENMVHILPAFEYKNVLELGCGCGLLTKELDNSIKFDSYDAIDMVDECGYYIDKISSKINFISQDIESYIPDKKYDLIISNASLQWLNDIPSYILKMKDYLNAGGVFAFTIFGQDNYREFKTILKSNLHYYSIFEIENMCEGYDVLNISEGTEILNFEHPVDVLKHIKNTGVNALSQTCWTRKDLIKFIDDYNLICENNITLTYNPIYVVLKKS